MKTKPNKTLAFVLAALSTAAVAPAFADDQPSHHNACPFTDRLRHWSDVDNHTIIVEMGVNQRYRVTFMNDCREMRFAIFANVISRPGICLSPGDRISFASHSGIPSDCVVQSVDKLPPRGTTPASAPSEEEDRD